MQTFTAKQYLEIDIATNFGLDKATWAERLAWFEMNRQQIEEGDINELKAGLLRKAKDAALVLGGIFAYRDTLAGEATGYTIGMDATASGLQLLSVLINCPLSAALCNVINSNKCVDGYTVVYEHCKKNGLSNQGISRKDAKQALMTHLYGSKVVPKQVFGEGEDLALFYGALDALLPGANSLNHALLTLWNPEALEHSWTLPDGFDVHIKVMADEVVPFKFLGMDMQAVRKVNAPQDSGLSIGANLIHSIDGMVVREMVRRCSISDKHFSRASEALKAKTAGKRTDRKRDLALIHVMACANHSGFLSARVLELIDRENVGLLTPAEVTAVETLLDSLPNRSFDLLTIHDCFRCHPNYGNDLRQQYVNILADISASRMLASLCSQIAGKELAINKIDPNMHLHVRNAEYAIC